MLVLMGIKFRSVTWKSVCDSCMCKLHAFSHLEHACVGRVQVRTPRTLHYLTVSYIWVHSQALMYGVHATSITYVQELCELGHR